MWKVSKCSLADDMALSKHSKVDLSESKPRFTNRNSNELYDIMENNNAANTKQATKSNLKIFMGYLAEKGLPKLEEITNTDLPKILFILFYGELRKTSAELYNSRASNAYKLALTYTHTHTHTDLISSWMCTSPRQIKSIVQRGVKNHQRIWEGLNIFYS